MQVCIVPQNGELLVLASRELVLRRCFKRTDSKGDTQYFATVLATFFFNPKLLLVRCPTNETDEMAHDPKVLPEPCSRWYDPYRALMSLQESAI